MPNPTNQEYLLKEQYRDSSKLKARLELHARFSTSKCSFSSWVFDQIEKKESLRILEVGCGDGVFWSDNIQRVLPNWDITLSDFSGGMVKDAGQKLRGYENRFQFMVADVQAIPFEQGTFDLVLANHMLYHVPEREKALSHIHRVLKPGGTLIATTNGRNHLVEFKELLKSFDSRIDMFVTQNFTEFGLENGSKQLSKYFPTVTRLRFDDALAVTEVQPLVDYVLSSRSNAKSILTGETLEKFYLFLESKLNSEEVIRFRKDSGLFKAIK